MDRLLYLFSYQKYRRGYVWSDNESESPVPSFADYSLTAEPLPSPPANELNNRTALKTIRTYPHLFEVVTPVKVGAFESLLRTHPNQPFVKSVCRGIREGFWPWADTSNPSLPVTWDGSFRPLRNPTHEAFAAKQVLEEYEAGRYSQAFGPNLLPGMYSMPVSVKPKPHSDDFRLVTDHSAEPHSLNSMIPSSETAVSSDDLRGFCLILRRIHRPNQKLILWKSDVKSAYRLMPMHPLWQIRQVVTLYKGDRVLERRVDRCNIWGGKGAGRIWCSFMSLVIWIAIHVKGIPDVLDYIDDVFSWEFADHKQWYPPYKRDFPTKQTKMLLLWDEIGIPHSEKKQVNGSPLTIIGFDVDPNFMRISLSAEKRQDIIGHIHKFTEFGSPKPVRQRTLRDFQQLMGRINSILDVFPLLKPGLCLLSQSIQGELKPQDPVQITEELCEELLWLADHVEKHSKVHGVSLLQSLSWDAGDSDLTIYADASSTGLSYWCPAYIVGYQASTGTLPTRGIFYLQTLAVVSALDWAASRCLRSHRARSPHHLRRVFIYCDNKGCVDVFSSMTPKPLYNNLFKFAVDILINNNIDLHVEHVPSERNDVADALSKFDNTLAAELKPKLRIYDFKLPAVAFDSIIA